jgi:hypothetical protein
VPPVHQVGADDLTIYRPGRDDLQPLAVIVSQADEPLSVQGDPDVASLPIRLQRELWHQRLPPEKIETVMPQNSSFVKDPPVARLRDSSDAFSPSHWGGKSFMKPVKSQET